MCLEDIVFHVTHNSALVLSVQAQQFSKVFCEVPLCLTASITHQSLFTLWEEYCTPKKGEREDLWFDLKSQTHRMFRVGRDLKNYLILPGAFQFALKFCSLGQSNILALTSPLGIEK